MKKILLATTIVVGCFAAGSALAADGVVSNSAAGGHVDYANAKPLPLPRSTKRPMGTAKALTKSIVFKGSPGAVNGHPGDGKLQPTTLPFNKSLAESDTSTGGFTSQQFGTSNHPFTTARANLYGTGLTVRQFPYRAAGKLFFNVDGSSFVCSASLIKRGVIVTAAHCVADFGKRKFYSGWRFVPAYNRGSAPYGAWTTRKRWIKSSYYDGTDTCAEPGVICENDVAVLELAAKNGNYPGTNTGWYGYAWGGYGFTGTGVADGNLGQITQLGYPVALDSGEVMERTDSYSYTDSSLSKNNVIGSQQSGGSSGGPWLINFGAPPTVTDSDGSVGSEYGSNRVVGTTSWGYTDSAIREQGASPFLATNIKQLVDSACSAAISASVCN